MLLRRIDLTTAFQPLPLQDETFLDVQDPVGLYEGYVKRFSLFISCNLLKTDRKYKIPQYQNGRVYLTSHRICYVDNTDPRKHSVAVDLKDVDTTEFYV